MARTLSFAFGVCPGIAPPCPKSRAMLGAVKDASRRYRGGLRPSLTAPARGARREAWSGRRDGLFRSNKGMLGKKRGSPGSSNGPRMPVSRREGKA
jgi:hypothetical protein